MALGILRRELLRLQATLSTRTTAAQALPILERLRLDPAGLMTEAGMTPDPWQTKLLRSRCSRALLLCSRQSGKSQTAAALALRAALLEPPALVLLLSPTQRQSGELFRDKVLPLFNRLGRPVAVEQQTALSLSLANGSRIIALPGKEEGIRGYSGVRLLVVDEAARAPEALYFSVRPMLAVSNGRLVALSTPFGRRGWFYEAWYSTEEWERVKITAGQCPRISAEFLEEEEAALGVRWFAQEYLCSFEDTVGAVFSSDDIAAAAAGGVPPLWPAGIVEASRGSSGDPIF